MQRDSNELPRPRAAVDDWLWQEGAPVTTTLLEALPGCDDEDDARHTLPPRQAAAPHMAVVSRSEFDDVVTCPMATPESRLASQDGSAKSCSEDTPPAGRFSVRKRMTSVHWRSLSNEVEEECRETTQSRDSRLSSFSLHLARCSYFHGRRTASLCLAHVAGRSDRKHAHCAPSWRNCPPQCYRAPVSTAAC
jgi:hypothetical protein